MQVKQRLTTNAVISVASALVILLVFSLALYRLDKADNLAKISGDIVLNSFERVTLRNDYLQNSNERAKAQWFARHEAFGKILKSASKYFRVPEDKKTIDELFKNHESIIKIFAAIVENREKKKSSSDEVVISQEVEDRLLSQLNIKVYEAVLHGRELLESSRRARSSAITFAGGWTASVLIILITAMIINSRTMGRAITERVRRLRDSALVIGGGDLDHRIDIKGDDEFAELSVAFNAMTDKLKTTYHELSNEVEERKRAEADVLKLSEDMAERNIELEAVNKELEAFVYSVSHDLRAPLRHISSFAKFLTEDYTDRLDDQGRDYLMRIKRGAEKMSRLIEDLMYLSQISRREVSRSNIDMSKLVSSIVADLREADPAKKVKFDIAEGITAYADQRLIEVALSNLLENAWKFTLHIENARIEFGGREQEGKTVYYVRDNGAGFNPEFIKKMFLPFQRMHSEKEFEGTGIGLAIVERVIRRHGGEVWAEGEVGKGAAMYFTLG